MTPEVPRRKRLRSVVQSTAHHAASRLCFLHPDLGTAFSRASLTRATLDLLLGMYRAPEPVMPETVRDTTQALLAFFAETARAEGISREALREATACFEFGSDGWPVSCRVSARPRKGEEVFAEVGASGNTLSSN